MVWVSLLLFFSKMSLVLDISKLLLAVLIQNKAFHKTSAFPIGKKS